MKKLDTKSRAQILGMMVEGNSIRAISRMTGASKNTIVKLLADAGDAFAAYQDKALRNLTCKRIQCDEIWAFVYAKAKNASQEMKAAGVAGDIWTWTAIDADTKLMVSWMVGHRTLAAARVFTADLAGRLANRVQLTTDGHRVYIQVVEDNFGGEVDYAMLVKQYGDAGGTGPERRYSSGDCCGTIKGTVSGCPDESHISTSYVERANLTMRMGMRRMTRLTNAFSKKVENLEHAVALHFMNYNLCRIHGSLRVTPAMEAGAADHGWSLEEVIALLS